MISLRIARNYSMIVTCAIAASAVLGQEMPAPTTAATPAQKEAAVSSFGKLPLSFERNEGQLQDHVIFACRLPHKFFIFRKKGLDIHITKRIPIPHEEKIQDTSTQPEAPDKLEKPNYKTTEHIAQVRFFESNPQPVIDGVTKLPGTVNYFIGNNPDNWKSSVKTFSKIKYTDLYPGIDLIYYGKNGMLEYDVVVRPGATPTAFKLYYNNAQRYRIDEEDNLRVHTDWGQLLEKKPIAYQMIGGERVEVAAKFILLDQESGQQNEEESDVANSVISFKLGDYDPNVELIIDPILGE